MTEFVTEEGLGIFWDGEEVDGVMAYGYWPSESPSPPPYPTTLWPEGTLFDTFVLTGSGWTVVTWDIRVFAWPAPDAWPSVLQGTLQRFLDHGARIAWFGLDFADPPSLFTPEEMSRDVYAALTREYGFVCTAFLGQPYRALSDDELLALHRLL